MTEQDYYGTKRVTAWRQEKDGKPGYGVRYRDGYESWSPASEFEAAYQPFTALSFGHAIEALKAGKRVARAGWNGKGMFLALVDSNGYWLDNGGAAEWAAHNLQEFDLLPWIGMKTADNKFVPWLASQTDVLATDWQIVATSQE